MGVPVKRLNKIGEGSPHVLDWIERGDVDLVVNTPTGSGARTDGCEIRRAAVTARHPLPDDARGRGSAGPRAIARAPSARRREPEVAVACRSCTAAAACGGGRRRPRRGRADQRRRSSRAERRRLPCLLPVADPDGPEARAGPVRDARRRRALGRGRGRAAVSAARVLDRAPRRGESHFLLEDVGPGTRRLCELRRGDGLWALGPLGRGFDAAAGRAPGAARRRRRRHRAAGDPPGRARDGGCRARSCCGSRRSGRRRRAARAAPRAARGHRRRLGRPPRPGHRPARRRDPARPHAVVYACGPAAMLEGVQALCARSGTPAQLALEAGMACGFGACFGCVVPRRDGGYLRVCVDGPGARRGRSSSASTSTPERRRERRVLRAEARPSGHQRLGHLRRDRRAAGLRRGAARGASRSPPTSPRRSRWSRAPATRRRGCGRRPRAWSTRSACPTRGSRATSREDLPGWRADRGRRRGPGRSR